MKIDWENKFYGFVENLSILFLSLTILPFLILAMYAHPSWDDYQFYAVAVQFGVWKAQYVWYMIWTGAFFSIFLLSVFNPLVYSSMLGYKLLGIVLIFGYLLTTYFLVKELSLKAVSKKILIICTLAITSVYLFKMANVAFGFYWMAASLKYMTPNLVLMITLTVMLKYFRETDAKRKFRQKVWIFILIFMNAGSSEISMIMQVTLMFLFVAISFIESRKINRDLLYFFVAACIAAAILFLAPGNSNRSMDFPNKNQLVFSIVHAGTDLVKFFPYRMLDTPLLLFTILFIPVCKKIIEARKNDQVISINPVYSIAVYLIVIFAGFFTTYWSVGEGPYDRTVNVAYSFFLIGWFFNVIVVVNYIQNKYEFKFQSLPKYVILIACLLIVFSYRKDNNVKYAYKDLIDGTVTRFDNELKARYNYLESDKADTSVMEKIKSPIPRLFFFYDVGPDASFKYNAYEATYFNKKAFIVNSDSTAEVKPK